MRIPVRDLENVSWEQKVRAWMGGERGWKTGSYENEKKAVEDMCSNTLPLNIFSIAMFFPFVIKLGLFLSVSKQY